MEVPTPQEHRDRDSLRTTDLLLGSSSLGELLDARINHLDARQGQNLGSCCCYCHDPIEPLLLEKLVHHGEDDYNPAERRSVVFFVSLDGHIDPW